MNIELMMLHVLDDPTGVRIIVNTKYPQFDEMADDGMAYLMIDRSDANDVYDANTHEKIQSAEIYDYWQVTDSLGQSKQFNSNVELIEFLSGIAPIIKRVYVESF